MDLKSFRKQTITLTGLLLATSAIAGCTQSASSVDTALQQPAATQQSTAQISQTAQTSSGQNSDVQSGQQVTANALNSETQTITGQNVLENQTQNAASTTPTLAETQTAALDPGKSMTFLPVEGAPQSAVSTLSKSLKTKATSQGLNVLAPTQSSTAAFRVKGYFSALSDGSGTLLVYVWDVLDQSGKRVHRINGQERSGTSKTDPWQAITDVELQRVADRTTARLKSWIDTKKS